jgi:hypothetical protein
MFTRIASRAAVLLGGLLVAGTVLVAPAANAAPNSPGACPSYAVTASTNTQLTISPRQPDAGQNFTATASVKSGGVPVTGGTVTFTFNGVSKTRNVVNGTASVTFHVPSSGGHFSVGASYSGQCLANSVATGTSSSRKAIVAGVSASRGHGGNGGNVAGTGAGIGGLAATGASGQTELLGVLGAGMVVVGGLALAVRRRRVNA